MTLLQSLVGVVTFSNPTAKNASCSYVQQPDINRFMSQSRSAKILDETIPTARSLSPLEEALTSLNVGFPYVALQQTSVLLPLSGSGGQSMEMSALPLITTVGSKVVFDRGRVETRFGVIFDSVIRA